MFEYWYLCKCRNNDHLRSVVSNLWASFQHIFPNFSTLFLLSSAAVWSGGEGGCSGPSTKIILSKVGFVHSSHLQLCSWPEMATPSSFPWIHLQLLRYISHQTIVIWECCNICRLRAVMMESEIKCWHVCSSEMPLLANRSASARKGTGHMGVWKPVT